MRGQIIKAGTKGNRTKKEAESNMNSIFKYELLDFCHKINGELYVFGAGECAKRLVPFLDGYGIRISNIIVSSMEDNLERINKFEIKSLQDLSFRESDGVVLALANDNPDIDIIRDELRARGIQPDNIYLQRVFFRTLTISDSGYDNGYFDNFNTLNDIGEKCGTDKSSKYHNYLSKYEFFLSRYHDQSITLLELGVLRGESLRMWKEFLRAGRIIGVDIDERCKRYEEERIHVLIGDLARREFVDQLTDFNPSVIVDDASHKWSHQVNALCTLFPTLCEGGVYILEDITTSFLEEGYDDASISAYDFCSAVSECVTGNTPLWKTNHRYEVSILSKQIEKVASAVEMISFIYGSCIIIKK